jgi:hypothetical protein
MKSLSAGAPHFRTEAKKYRNANYTLEKVVNEDVDNIIKKATEIRLTTDVDSDGRLQELKISDNYINGFENINKEGVENPFNMGHIRSGHDADDETSEFGVGMKAGAISAANELSVVSNVGGTYYHVLCNFLKMEKEEDVNASYNPKIKEITEEEYRQIHPFATGSSIIMSKIRDTICDRTTQRELTERLKKGISETYSRFLRATMQISVNAEPVTKEIDFFSDPKCAPFTTTKKMFVLEKVTDKIFLMKKTIENTVWQIYKDGKWIPFKQNAYSYMSDKINEGYKYAYSNGCAASDGSCMKLDTVFAFYSDHFHGKEEPEKPFDQVLIYKDDRKYAKKSLAKIVSDGNNNYTQHRIDFSSKKIGKELGITFNKDITMEQKNDLTMAVKAAIDDNRTEYNSNVSTGKNEKLCEKALKRQVIDLLKCPFEKLSNSYRDLRKKHELDEKKKEEMRKKKEEDELRRQMEADILRKKQEAEDLRKKQEADKAEQQRIETERLRLEEEKLRLEILAKETPKQKAARLAKEEKDRKAKEQQELAQKAKEEQEQLRLEQLRLEQEQAKKAQEEQERQRQEELRLEQEQSKKVKEEQERQRQEELKLEAERQRLELLKAEQEESRKRLREASQLIMDTIASDELISLNDSDSILNKVKELLKK